MWGAADDAKLLELFRTPHNSVDPNKLDVPAVKAVHKKYFSQFKYKNFALLYRGKARSFQVSKTLDGHRKRSAVAKKKAAAAVEEKETDSSDDSDFNPEEEEEDIDLDPDLEEEDDQEEEVTMPPSAKKRTPRRAASSPVPTSIDEVSTSMGAMNLSSNYCMSYSFPYLISTYSEGFDVMCKIELFTQMIPRDYFLLDIADGGHSLEMHTRVPDFFIDETRVAQVRAGREGFNGNTSEAQAFKNICEEVENAHSDKGIIFSGDPQRITLPFRCEARINEWEVQAYPNNLLDADFEEAQAPAEGEDEVLEEVAVPEQYHAVLHVLLQKLRTKRKTKGGFRKLG